jgi:hypothetical protein
VETVITKLYSAYTITSVGGRDAVHITWYVWEQDRWSEDQLEKFVENYSNLDPRCKEKAKKYLNEYFTEQEVTQFAEHIKKYYNEPLLYSEHPIPMKTYVEENGSIKPILPLDTLAVKTYVGIQEDTTDIYNVTGDGLSFEVIGHYDPIDGAPSRDKLPIEMVHFGTFFLTEAMRRLSPGSKWDEETLEALVKDIYKEESYYVNRR